MSILVEGRTAARRARRCQANVVDGPRMPSQKCSTYHERGSWPSVSITGSGQATMRNVSHASGLLRLATGSGSART